MREARSCWAMSSNIWLSIKSRYCWRGHPRRSSRAWRIYGVGKSPGPQTGEASEDGTLSPHTAEVRDWGRPQDKVRKSPKKGESQARPRCPPLWK